MPAPPVPADEQKRLHALYALEVLDSAPERFTQAVAAMAATIANVPMTAVSLVDSDRQWFKASCGLAATQTGRDVSFCAHAILQTEPLIVEDALADPRFSDNSLVTGAPFIRFYAGFPLVVNGQAVGALCVIDDRPRRLTDIAVDHLRTLADGTAAWMVDRNRLEQSLYRAESNLTFLTTHDALTELPNKLAFEGRLEQATERCHAVNGQLAVFLVDLDGYKGISGAWGNLVCEGILRDVAQRLREVARPNDMIAHVGIDQFQLLLEGVGQGAAAKLASRITAQLSAPFASSIGKLRLTASIGIAIYPKDGTAEQLSQCVASAMDTAKKAGGDTFRFFDIGTAERVKVRTSLTAGLRLAIEQGELELHYQAKVNAKSSRIIGVEALVRWRRPGYGMVSPADFIPEAERSGLIIEIGKWVLAQSCRQIRIWAAMGIDMPVAVNLSARQLQDTSLPPTLARMLRIHGIAPRLLTCEITESAAMSDVLGAAELFQRFQTIGVKLSIDDFGTGYSSLSYLRRLKVQQLKIDRSFVIDLAESDDARAVVSAIVNLAHCLRLEVVAEGVETVAQRNLLLEMGCDEFQGYLFAKPLPAAGMTELIQADAALGLPSDSPPVEARSAAHAPSGQHSGVVVVPHT